VCVCVYLKLVRDKQHRLVARGALDGVPEEVGAHAGVHGAQGVVQEQDGPPAVEGPRQAHPLPLAPTEVGPPLADLEEEEETEDGMEAEEKMEDEETE